ncbi:pectinesterase inhibitor isoform X2 [Prunus yedoensis var. nudiflora]|uniref:Pectinesterase inhibitor isoform X2 n=1 Tax=Prunus yedoensis var. nudiflora TaxID=2094558 RepID=A0A314Z297_PRUYE|nr:pectinesterase inhibitor isoform X2 [Prunus yedoensis var. nudiflora]
MNPIAAAAFVFLSTLSVLQFVLVAGHESQSTNGGSKAGVVNVNLIQQACQHAPQKDLCINTLKNDPNSKGADLTGSPTSPSGSPAHMPLKSTRT